MSRGLSSSNQTSIAAAHVHEVVLVAFDFDTPVYVHSGIGTITYDGNDYIGVGEFGGISGVEESEQITVRPLELTLSGLDNDQYPGIDQVPISDALDAGKYGDAVTIYEGYRNDDGTLADDPWIVATGIFESAAISLGGSNEVVITVQHDLARLEEKNGARYTFEDQQTRFSGDIGFAFVHAVIGQQLLWGGRRVIDRGTYVPSDKDPKFD